MIIIYKYKFFFRFIEVGVFKVYVICIYGIFLGLVIFRINNFVFEAVVVINIIF